MLSDAGSALVGSPTTVYYRGFPAIPFNPENRRKPMNPFLFAPPDAPAQSPLVQFAPLALLFLVFYFLLIRPASKRQKARDQLIAGLEKGSKVVTSGGIVGTVASVKGDVVALKVSDKLKIDVMKSNVSQLYKAKQNGE